MLARNQLGQVFSFLRLTAVATEVIDAKVRMRAKKQADRSRRPRVFLDRDAMLQSPEPRAAVLLLDGDAVQSERADLRPEVSGKLVALVDLGRTRRDLVTCEIMHGFANGIRGFAEIEVEHPMRVGDHGLAASG